MTAILRKLSPAAAIATLAFAFAASPLALQFDGGAPSLKASAAFAKNGSDDGSSGSDSSGSGRGGNDDGPDHDANDDHGGNGQDDGPDHDVNDDHGGHGLDDGPDHDVNDDHGGLRPRVKGQRRNPAEHGAGHTSLEQDGVVLMARRAADDGANHDAGDDKRGRGKDDGVNHA